MEILLIILHVVVSLFLVFVVLLQSGQAADLAGAFGGGGSQTALGMRGAATLLQKLTTAAAVIFMLTSLALGIVGRSARSSVIEGLDETAPVSAPAETPPADPGQQQ
jgi:preprotein translocase subunit SecG